MALNLDPACAEFDRLPDIPRSILLPQDHDRNCPRASVKIKKTRWQWNCQVDRELPIAIAGQQAEINPVRSVAEVGGAKGKKQLFERSFDGGARRRSIAHTEPTLPLLLVGLHGLWRVKRQLALDRHSKDHAWRPYCHQA